MKTKTEQLIRKHFWIDKDTLEKLERICEVKPANFSMLVRAVLKEYATNEEVKENNATK